MGPLGICIIVAAGVAAACWLLALVTREYSWTDRIWSLAPVAYAWIFAGAAGLDDARLDLAAVLVTLWGARLTFNFARKGGYARGGEDYRWSILRAGMPAWQWQLFNLAFIAAYQNAIIALMTLPIWTMYQHQRGFSVWDVLLAILAVALLVGETVADQQQWNCHRAKATGSTSSGFLTAGLFRFSRHPNYFCEVMFWWVVFALSIVAAHAISWTIAGPVLLSLLFVGSIRFTESISASKYPDYAEYRRRTSGFVPLPARR